MKVISCKVDNQPVLHLVIQYEDGRCEQYAFGEGDLRDYLNKDIQHLKNSLMERKA